MHSNIATCMIAISRYDGAPRVVAMMIGSAVRFQSVMTSAATLELKTMPRTTRCDRWRIGPPLQTIIPLRPRVRGVLRRPRAPREEARDGCFSGHRHRKACVARALRAAGRGKGRAWGAL